MNGQNQGRIDRRELQNHMRFFAQNRVRVQAIDLKQEGVREMLV